MITRLSLLLIFVTNITFGQHDSIPKKVTKESSKPLKENTSENGKMYFDDRAWIGDTMLDNKLCLKIVPLALLDFYGGYSYRLATEFKVYRNIAFSLDGGGYFGFFKNVGGFIIKPELKFYLNKSGHTVGKFLSVEYVYKEQSYGYSDTVRLSTPKYFVSTRISKYVSCFNIKFGDTRIFYKRFIFERFVGIGIRIKNSTNGLTQQEFANIGDNEQRGGVGVYYNTVAGHFIQPNITAGIKIGYRFK